MNSEAIGGYFELELPVAKQSLYPQALRYQSARSAFYALILYVNPRRIWMPLYICDAMLAPVHKAGVEVSFYSLNDDFSIKEDLKLQENDLLLYVNYFGVCGKQQLKILEKYNSDQIVFDHSQAFFQAPLDCLATIYSPRKFFGVPDGGFLVTNVSMVEPEEIDEDSIKRSIHLLKRLADSAEFGYLDYQLAEKTLMDFVPKKMSKLTERLLSVVDYDAVRTARNENFLYIHSILGGSNKININLSFVDGPMVYPFLYAQEGLKDILIKSRVFISTYWAECIDKVEDGCFEQKLVNMLVPLPCDQRYALEEIRIILSVMNRIGI
ncbi:hypothetical protein [Desulfotalea psychrophila]|nr:hypothetical protein [Desulfotalea psychrophila]